MAKNSGNPWKTISSKTVYQNPWIRVREDAVIKPDGSEGIYGVMESKDSVIVVVLDKDARIFMVQGYSYPVSSWNWQLPGGGGEGQEAEEASRRELLEETGIEANDWTFLGKVRVCDGLMTERMAVFLAQDLSSRDKPAADDDDFIGQGEFFSFEEIDRMVDSGDIDDGQTLTALFLVQKFLRHHPAGS